MANGNFVVQNGLTVGPLTIDAATGSISTSGNVTVTGNLGVSQISKNDSVIAINDTGTGSNVKITVDGTNQATVWSGGMIANSAVSVGTTLDVAGNVTLLQNLYIGTGSNATAFTAPTIVASEAGATFSQLAMINTTSSGSADIVVYANNGTDTNGWADVGFTGNAFSDASYTITGKNDGYLFVNGAPTFGGNAVIATGSGGVTNDIIFATGGFLTANERFRWQHATNTLLPAANTTANIGSTTRYLNNLYSATGTFSGQITSTVATGSAPFVIASTTKVAGLNVEQVDGYDASTTSTANTLVVRDAAANVAVGNLSATNLTGTITTASQGSITTMAGLTGFGTAGVTTTAAGHLTVTGNLTINGTTTTINATTVTVNDLNMVLANNQSTSATVDGAGIDIGGGTPIATWRYNHASTSWQSNVDITPTANASIDLGDTTHWWNNVYGVTFIGVSTTAKYADLAENYASDAEYEPGTVVCFGGEAEVTVCSVDHCRKVAGVVSTDPAYLMNSDLEGTKVAVALQGRVPCKVVGPVQKGDMMVSAGNGRARAEADPKLGAVIGKALENFDGAEGVIEVVVGRT